MTAPPETPEQRGAKVLASCAANRTDPVYVLGVLDLQVERLLKERDGTIKERTSLLDQIKLLTAVAVVEAKT